MPTSFYSNNDTSGVPDGAVERINENRDKIAELREELDADVTSGSGLRTDLDALVASTDGTADDLTNHVDDDSNPHSVTAQQVGAQPTHNARFTGKVGIGGGTPAKTLVVSDGGAMGIEVSPNDSNNGFSRIISYDRSLGGYAPLTLDVSTFRLRLNGSTPSSILYSNSDGLEVPKDVTVDGEIHQKVTVARKRLMSRYATDSLGGSKRVNLICKTSAGQAGFFIEIDGYSYTPTAGAFKIVFGGYFFTNASNILARTSDVVIGPMSGSEVGVTYLDNRTFAVWFEVDSQYVTFAAHGMPCEPSETTFLPQDSDQVVITNAGTAVTTADI